MSRPVARKRFGQHFLQDSRVIEAMLQAISPQQGEHLTEIGPGRGALTFPLLAKQCHLDLIEIDRDLIAFLAARCAGKGKHVLHEADALTFDFRSLLSAKQNRLRIVGNLPYNISTPLLFHLLAQSDCIEDMHFMLQKEVADRITARHGERARGRLSVMIQYHCQAVHLFDVGPEAFSPPPQVHSSVIRLVPFREKPFIAQDETFFAHLIKTAFSQPRKTLRNTLKPLLGTAVSVCDGPVNFSLRPGQASVAEYVALCNQLLKT